MIIIREVFIAKPGMAGKLAKLLKSVLMEVPNQHFKVMTDMTGQFNKVVLETEADSWQDFEGRMKEYSMNPSFKEKMSGYTEMYTTGKREIFQVI